jgi:hypothetical protein
MVSAGLLLGRQGPCGLPARAPRSGKPAHDAAAHERRILAALNKPPPAGYAGTGHLPTAPTPPSGTRPAGVECSDKLAVAPAFPLCGDIGFQQYPRWQLLLCRTCAFPDQLLKLRTFLFTQPDNVFLYGNSFFAIVASVVDVTTKATHDFLQIS